MIETYKPNDKERIGVFSSCVEDYLLFKDAIEDVDEIFNISIRLILMRKFYAPKDAVEIKKVLRSFMKLKEDSDCVDGAREMLREFDKYKKLPYISFEYYGQHMKGLGDLVDEVLYSTFLHGDIKRLIRISRGPEDIYNAAMQTGAKDREKYLLEVYNYIKSNIDLEDCQKIC